MHRNYRDRAPLDLARELNCTLHVTGVCEVGPGESCQSDQYRHGRGSSTTAYNGFFASGCRSCRRELDQGRRFTRDGRVDSWQRARGMKVLQFWKRSHLTARA